MPRKFFQSALRRAVLFGLCAPIAAFLCGSLAATAEDYPVRPITLIVPYPPGGGVDTMGRIVGQKLSVALGQQVIIENRPGAGGMIGTRVAVKAAPDGYTLVMTLTGLSLGPNPGYDVAKDIAPIGLIAFTPVIVMAHPSLPAKSLADVIALAKKEPGKLAVGTPPPPTMNYFAVELFKIMAGVDVSIITYKGTAPLTNDLLGGHVLVGFNTIPASIGQIEAGLYYGLSAPAGTPRPIIERLNKELRLAITSADMQKRLVAEGADPVPSTPEEYAVNLEREEARWGALIKKIGLKFE